MLRVEYCCICVPSPRLSPVRKGAVGHNRQQATAKDQSHARHQAKQMPKKGKPQRAAAFGLLRCNQADQARPAALATSAA